VLHQQSHHIWSTSQTSEHDPSNQTWRKILVEMVHLLSNHPYSFSNVTGHDTFVMIFWGGTKYEYQISEQVTWNMSTLRTWEKCEKNRPAPAQKIWLECWLSLSKPARSSVKQTMPNFNWEL
jgi:hypothetical protein